jgi:hypothetical protein
MWDCFESGNKTLDYTQFWEFLDWLRNCELYGVSGVESVTFSLAASCSYQYNSASQLENQRCHKPLKNYSTFLLQDSGESQMPVSYF